MNVHQQLGQMVRTIRWLALLGTVFGLSSTQGLAAAATPASLNMRSSELFRLTNIWTAHFHFTAEQWEAMQPQGPAGNWPNPSTPPATSTASGPAGIISTLMIQAGDSDRDGELSEAEFAALAERWFSSWDSDKSEKLTLPKLSAGLGNLFSIPNLVAATFGMPARPIREGERFSLQGTAGARNGLASRLGFEFEYVRANLEMDNLEFRDVAVRYKGNGTFMASRNSVKRPLKVDLNDFVKGQKLAGQTKLNFHNNVSDPSWMNEVLAYRLFRDAGVPASRTAFARVLVTVPGKFDRRYFGLYSLVENVDEQFANERFGTKEGAFFKPSTPELFADLGNDWEKYQQTYDPKNPVSDAAIRRLLGFVQLLNKSNDGEFAARAGEFIDFDEFARFLAVTVSLSALDSILGIGQNYYLYFDPKSQKFQFFPWDEDHSFGQLGGTQPQRENLSIHKPWQGENKFLDRMFAVRAFKEIYLRHLSEIARTLFTPKRLASQVEEIATAIRPAVKEESTEKLALFEAAIAGKPSAANNAGITRGAKPINAFMPLRSRSLLDQLSGRADGMTIAGAALGGGGATGDRGGGANPGVGAGLALVFLSALDADKNGMLNREEFTRGFGRWFELWNLDANSRLSREELGAGLTRSLLPGQ